MPRVFPHYRNTNIYDNAYEHYDSSAVEENVYRSRRFINQLLARTIRRWRGRSVDWWFCSVVTETSKDEEQIHKEKSIWAWVEHSCYYCYITVRRKIKQSHNRLGQALRVPGGWGSQISRQSAHEGGRVVSPTHRPPFTPQDVFLVLISVRGWVDSRVIVRPEGLCQWKIPMTPSRIEPATFWLVAQCLNQLRHRATVCNNCHLTCLVVIMLMKYSIFIEWRVKKLCHLVSVPSPQPKC